MTVEALREDFRISHLPPYLLGQIAEEVMTLRSQGTDVVDLSKALPDQGPPQAAVDKLVQAALRPHNHRYSASQGITKLREAVARWYSRRYGVEIDADREAVVTLGTKEGLAHLLLAVLNPGDNVLLPTPSYPVHSAAISIAGAVSIQVPLFADALETQSSGLSLTSESSFFERLEAAHEHTWPQPRALVMSFPHNPTTATVDRSFFERLVTFARARGMFLIHDFAYSGMCFDGYVAPSLLEVEGASECAIEFSSLSKGFSMAGWRIGFAAGNTQLIAALKKIKGYLDFGAFTPLQIAAVEVLDRHESALEENNEVYRSRRDVLVGGLKQLGWDVVAPKATLFTWARIPERFQAEGSLGFCRHLLHDAHVAVCPGGGFHHEADGFVRFALVEKEARIRQAIKQMGTLFER